MPFSSDNLQPRIRTMQIIAAALLMGVISFLVVVLVMRSSQPESAQPEMPILSLMAVGMLTVNATLAFLLPPAIARGQLARLAGTSAGGTDDGDVVHLLGVAQTVMIIRLALLEGAGFLGCIAYLIEGRPLALLAVGIAVMLQLLLFPSMGRVQGWLDGLRQQLIEVRRGM